MINVEQTIISQYANSPTISQLCKNIDLYIDPRADIDEFFNHVWNIDTAIGFGLDIWGRILGVGRSLTVPADITYFGFLQALPDATGFNQGPFFNSENTQTQTYLLPDDSYRQLLLVKAMTNISSGNVPSINNILTRLFDGRGRCYAIDDRNMTMRLTFEFNLTPVEAAILNQSDIIPRPAGVKLTLVVYGDLPFFGFAQAGYGVTGFNQSPFYSN